MISSSNGFLRTGLRSQKEFTWYLISVEHCEKVQRTKQNVKVAAHPLLCSLLMLRSRRNI